MCWVGVKSGCDNVPIVGLATHSSHDHRLGSQSYWYSGSKSTEVACPQIDTKPFTKLKWPVVIRTEYSSIWSFIKQIFFEVFNYVLVPCEELNLVLPQELLVQWEG